MRDALGFRRALGAGLVLALIAVAPARAQTPGAAGGGDPYFPAAGNGGYDVRNYRLNLWVKPALNRLVATAVIKATATQGLSRFDLDLRRLRVRAVFVDGSGARFVHRRGELAITPAAPIPPGEKFRIRVRYRGHPRPLSRPQGFDAGWFRTGDGTVVASEPWGSPSWFPCNDTPVDKATYEFNVIVPRGRLAVANGTYRGFTRRAHGNRAFHWVESSPMATYLATVATGRFRLRKRLVTGIPSWTAVDPLEARRSGRGLAHLGAVIKLLRPLFGDYPFDATGAIVDSADLGFALETQTRPVFDRPPNASILAHEIAHQWYGDAVTLERWSQIWLHEGFANWSQWLWDGKHGGFGPAANFRLLYRVPATQKQLWNPPPGRPGVKKMFAASVYLRGAMAVEALRQKVGDPAFRAILRRWISDRLYGNGSIDDFIALAEAESGQQLDHFFQVWLFKPGKPTNW